MLARRILQAIDLVEIPVVESLDKGADRAGDVPVIEEQPRSFVYLASDGDIEPEGVAVKASTLVSVGEIWQTVRRLETECLGELDDHGGTLFVRWNNRQTLSCLLSRDETERLRESLGAAISS